VGLHYAVELDCASAPFSIGMVYFLFVVVFLALLPPISDFFTFGDTCELLLALEIIEDLLLVPILLYL